MEFSICLPYLATWWQEVCFSCDVFGFWCSGSNGAQILFFLRCLWLLVFREQWSTDPKTLKEKDWTAVREVIKFDQLQSLKTPRAGRRAREMKQAMQCSDFGCWVEVFSPGAWDDDQWLLFMRWKAGIRRPLWCSPAKDVMMINGSFLCDERLGFAAHCGAAQQRMCAKATGEGIGEGIPLLKFFQCVYLQEVRIFGTHPDMLKQRRISPNVPFNSTKVVASCSAMHFQSRLQSWLTAWNESRSLWLDVYDGC